MTQKETTDFIKSKIFSLLGWILFFILLWFNGCKEKQQALSKPKTGTFKPIKPNIVNLGTIDTLLITKFVKGKTIIEYKNNEVNKELANENYNLQIAYVNASDSVERLKMYINAIQLKKFEKTFENDDFSAIVKGISQGEVKEIGLDYKIKPKSIPVTKFRLLGGVGINTDAINANLGFQNAKGSVFEIGYDTEKRINIGYKQSIFKIVK